MSLRYIFLLASSVVWQADGQRFADIKEQSAQLQSSDPESAPQQCQTASYVAPSVAGAPKSQTRKIVILGSSTAAGYGATSYQVSWAGKLTLQMRKVGLTVLNRSISGTNTQDSLARFDRDVVPERPDVVVICTSVLNEGFLGDPVAVSRTYLSNVRALISKVLDIGAVPVVTTMYPSARYAERHIAVLRGLNADLEQFGVPVVDFWGAVSSEGGQWLDGYSEDGVHPTDRGHERMYDAIPTAMFDWIYQTREADGAREARHPLSDAVGENPGNRIKVVLERPASSWTIVLNLRKTERGDAPSVVQDSGGQQWRIGLVGDQLVVQLGSRIQSVDLPVRTDHDAWQQLVISFHAGTQKLLAYYAGMPALSIQHSAQLDLESFDLGSDCGHCSFAHVLTYRSPLGPGEVEELANLKVLRRSLETWAPIQGPLEQLPVNAVGQGSRISLEGSWTLNRFPSPRKCVSDQGP